jgi:multidrug efflux pump
MKQFFATTWSINNRTSIYIVTIIITLFGIISYNALQKEKFPDIVIPKIFVSTIYQGTTPAQMENLVTRPIEKAIKSTSGVKKVTSTSMQDFSMIIVEFNTDVKVADAKQRIKDAVDKAKNDLPKDLPSAPSVANFELADLPILFVNISGEFEMDKLKKYADDIKDKIEALPQITKVNEVGALDKEIQVNVDVYKAQVNKITLSDIIRAIQSENVMGSGGNIRIGDMSRSLQIDGQFTNPQKIGDIVVKSPTGTPVFIKDLAEVKEGYKDRESFARLANKPVITLNVIKRSGENLIAASDSVQSIVKQMKKTTLPSNLDIVITGDQSSQTRNTLNDLINTIIIGFVLVTLILMFFMGTTNALFVGLSVPLSMFLAFCIMPTMGFTLNMIVLFAFLLALGIVVDDAIVVIENTHRIYHNSNFSIKQSAKLAAGEIFIPVFAGTLTTLAPFVPLAFWPGIIGKFMYFLPITLIITLTASLIVAFIINPVFAVSFMKREHGEEAVIGVKKNKNRSFYIALGILGFVALVSYALQSFFFGNLTLFIIAFIVLNKFVLNKLISGFQNNVWPAFINAYEKALRWVLKGWHPILAVLIVIGLFVLMVVLMIARPPKIGFFPKGDPNFIYTYIQLPIGTDVNVTDSVTKVVEKKIYGVIGDHNPDVESVITNVAINAGDQNDLTVTAQSNKGKVSIAFKEFANRTGPSTAVYLDKIRDAVKGIPAASITVDQEAAGPPTGKPVNIEITGEDFLTLVNLSKRTKKYIDSLQIYGIEDLKSDLEDQKPEIRINVDRERANREGISTGQIVQEIRNAVYGQDNASKFKRNEDEYPIMVRYAEPYRKRIDDLLNMRITFRDMGMGGQIRQVPISAVTNITYDNTYGGIKRNNLKRVITLSSNVLTGANANEIVAQVKSNLKFMNIPDGYEIKLTGEQEDQKETQNFLGLALILSLCLIFLILVTQFNSFSKTIIILTEIFFSIIGVFLGFAIFKMTISIVMVGVGIVALAGIVVKNGILLIEFTDVMRERGHKTFNAIIQGGRTRITPVLLTATATMLGLVPLALGMNIDFYELFAKGKPHFFLGGDSSVFWGPLAWTIIFGLSFATTITLLIVPALYLMNLKFKIWLKRRGILPRSYKI